MIPPCIQKEEFYYRDQPTSIIKKFCEEFRELLEDFANTIGVSTESELEINYPALVHLYKRIDQRTDYFLYFHSRSDETMDMSQKKELALCAYWTCKYKVIRFSNIGEEEQFFLDNGCTVSDAFAAYILISSVCSRNEAKADYFTKRKVMELYYDFSNRDFSKEAIIARIEDLIA